MMVCVWSVVGGARKTPRRHAELLEHQRMFSVASDALQVCITATTVRVWGVGGAAVVEAVVVVVEE